MTANSIQKPPISFSIVLEAATITAGTQDSLRTCLEFLSKQDLSPWLANEFLLMDVGNLGHEVAEELLEAYPWVTFKKLPQGTRYFEAKMAGFQLATGEVVVFCDGDNRYFPNWLSSMVRAFAEHPKVSMLVGQTSVEVNSLLATVFALTFYFPSFSDPEEELTPATFYYGNNSAFRRSFLNSWPIPTTLPLLRGNCYVHSVLTRRQGHQIWRQNRAKAFHDPPETLAEFIYRYLARGSDRVEIARLTRPSDSQASAGPLGSIRSALKVAIENFAEFLVRIAQLPRTYPKAMIYYPLALPLAAGLLLLIFVGMGYSLVRPGVLTAAYLRHQYPKAKDGKRVPRAGLKGDLGS